jgi:quercetin dioxygenase-like cupin family protein
MTHGRAIVVEGLKSAEFRETSQPVYDRPFKLRLLYQDPRSGAEHYLVRYPVGLQGRAHRHTAAHTIVVLAGQLEVNGRVVGPGAYCHFPGGETMTHAPAPGASCLFVIIFDGPFDLEAVGD